MHWLLDRATQLTNFKWESPGFGPLTYEPALKTTALAATLLFAHGETTERTVSAAERLGRALGVTVRVLPYWGEIIVELDGYEPLTFDKTTVAIGESKPLKADLVRITGTVEIKRRWPEVEVVAVTSFLEEGKIRAVLEAGAAGYRGHFRRRHGVGSGQERGSADRRAQSLRAVSPGGRLRRSGGDDAPEVRRLDAGMDAGDARAFDLKGKLARCVRCGG